MATALPRAETIDTTRTEKAATGAVAARSDSDLWWVVVVLLVGCWLLPNLVNNYHFVELVTKSPAWATDLQKKATSSLVRTLLVSRWSVTSDIRRKQQVASRERC